MTLPVVDWEKMQGLVPAIIQDANSGAVLMMGYMNREALAATQTTGRVTFWSRSKARLWTKGESSGHFLEVRSIAVDCDQDTLLVLVEPTGPACHLGTNTCWGADAPRSLAEDLAFLGKLEHIVAQRIAARPEGSYTAQLFTGGIDRIQRKTYIYCNDPEPTTFTPFYERLKGKPGWTIHTLPCTHFAQMDMPKESAELLLQAIP